MFRARLNELIVEIMMSQLPFGTSVGCLNSPMSAKRSSRGCHQPLVEETPIVAAATHPIEVFVSSDASRVSSWPLEPKHTSEGKQSACEAHLCSRWRLVAARGKALIIIFISLQSTNILGTPEQYTINLLGRVKSPCPSTFLRRLGLCPIDESVRGRWSCKRSLQC